MAIGRGGGVLSQSQSAAAYCQQPRQACKRHLCEQHAVVWGTNLRDGICTPASGRTRPVGKGRVADLYRGSGGSSRGGS